MGEFIDVVPPQQRIDEQWYQGTADAVYQNIYTIEQERPEHVVILAGDHIYKMDYSKMIDFHKANDADLTIAALQGQCRRSQAFGVMQIDAEQSDCRLRGEIANAQDDSRRRPTLFGFDGHLCLQRPFSV